VQTDIEVAPSAIARRPHSRLAWPMTFSATCNSLTDLNRLEGRAPSEPERLLASVERGSAPTGGPPVPWAQLQHMVAEYFFGGHALSPERRRLAATLAALCLGPALLEPGVCITGEEGEVVGATKRWPRGRTFGTTAGH